MEIEKFHNTLIAFDTANEMVNATDMLKAFPNRRMGDYLRLKGTKELITFLESVTGNPVTVVKQGGSEQGTWMHRILAIDFAAWLSVEFRFFVYKVFDESQKEKIRSLELENGYLSNRYDIDDAHNRRF